MIVTREFVLDNKTQSGGWTFPQLALLGAGWPPKKGWLSRVVGAEITDEIADRFVALGKAGKQPKSARKKNKSESLALSRQIAYADTSKTAKPGRTYIFCPFSEKDEAKALGAMWDKGRRMWFVRDGLDLALFKKWLAKPKSAPKQNGTVTGKHYAETPNPPGLLPWEEEDPPELIRMVRDIGAS